MNELRSAVDAVLAEDPHTLSGPELAGRLVALEREIARLMSAQLAALAVFEARRDFVDDGAVNAASWLRHHCRLSPGDASSRVRMARRLRDQLDDTADALADGQVTFAQARVICEQAGRVADRLGQPGVVALKQAEPFFLEAAQRLHPNDLGKVVKRWEQVIDADGFLSEADKAYERRFLNLSQGWDGMWHLDGVLDPESGATLAAAIRPLASPQGTDDSRTAGQRRTDALVEIARRALDSGTLPAAGGEKPHVTVEVTLDSLEGRLGMVPGELAGTPIPAETARRLACDAGITRIVTGPESEPLDVGRRTRSIPAGLRRALTHRDKGCAYTGCDYPAEWTDAHHIQHWADGGPTSLDNLVLLCRRHHRAIHEGDVQVERPPPAKVGASTAREHDPAERPGWM